MKVAAGATLLSIEYLGPRVLTLGSTFSKALSKGQLFQFERTAAEKTVLIANKVTGYTKHGLNQAIGRDWGRGVNIKAILDAVKNPIKVIEQCNKTKFIGKDANVVLNNKGKVISTFGKSRGPQIWNEGGVVQVPYKL